VTGAGRIPRLGPTVGKDGVRFRLLAPQATAVSVGLFRDEGASSPHRTVSASRGPEGVWTALVPSARPGALYAWSVDGPHLPGTDFDPARFLLDPGGWEVARSPNRGLCGLSRVANPEFDWQGTRRPTVSASRRVVYELHVKGFTKRHPSVPAALQGTYAGLVHPEALAHLKALGVSTVELLPAHAHLDDAFLLERGLLNYWGYNTLSWFAPQAGYSSDGRGADEFRQMVRELHRAGLEVVLDVVYNHSCEDGLRGVTTSLRGLGTWYRPDPADPSLYQDFTGCGNTLDFRLPRVRALVLESLRHWVRDFRVDGFRFDLAAVFGRLDGRFDPSAPFFMELAADPVLRDRILIAEPWDATAEGYSLGRYPRGWMEWNDRFRDDLRLFWKGEVDAHAFASRMGGNSDLFPERGPCASVNYAACHDGFTLRDLCCYRHKHNEPNGEANRDGSDWNHSDNLGHEGDTVDPLLLEHRARRARNLLAGALLSLGTPMLLAGDEMGRTQCGNNNAYCQDNAVSWLDWGSESVWPDPEWTASVIGLRRDLSDPSVEGPWLPADHPDVSGVLLRDGRRRRLLLARRGRDPRPIPLPPGRWQLRLDTTTDAGAILGQKTLAVLSGGEEAFFVLDSPVLRNGSVKGENPAASSRGSLVG
jgi:pullulanase/glycogen debranching enzyme